MFFSKSSQVFELNKQSSFQVPTPVLTGEVYFFFESFHRTLNPIGIFPRRVDIGEIVLSQGEFFVLSSVEGIASIDPVKKKLNINLDGKLNPKPQYDLREYSFQEIQEKLKNLGIVSLDWEWTPPLHVLLQKFKDEESSIIVFAPFTENNFINFQSKILEKYPSELKTLIENFRKIFPKSKLYDFILDSKTFREYSYPEGNPTYFLNKYCKKPLNQKLDLSSILYLGPETLYYMIEALYYSIPFVERFVSVYVINQDGLLEGKPRFFKLKNGTNLTTFFSMIREKYGYKYFTLNSFFEKNPVYEIGAEMIFDMYTCNSLIICEEIISQHKETLCIDCNDCNYFCPVSANPRALLDKDKSLFLSQNCIECGLCSVFCPSHIDFSTRIREWKQEPKFAIS